MRTLQTLSIVVSAIIAMLGALLIMRAGMAAAGMIETFYSPDQLMVAGMAALVGGTVRLLIGRHC